MAVHRTDLVDLLIDLGAESHGVPDVFEDIFLLACGNDDVAIVEDAAEDALAHVDAFALAEHEFLGIAHDDARLEDDALVGENELLDVVDDDVPQQREHKEDTAEDEAVLQSAFADGDERQDDSQQGEQHGEPIEHVMEPCLANDGFTLHHVVFG